MKNKTGVNWSQHQLVGRSPEFEAAITSANLIANLEVPVLLLGENGTGKELFARAIHHNSKRRTHNFVALNCAAIPESLFEAELFGFRKGSFTSAERDYTGKILSANNGTLFLDEIAELTTSSQAKLLRFLESSECQGIGQASSNIVNVRVIAATNQDLPGLIKEGKFRKDLYYRLNVVPLEIPPLRKRVDDISYLLDHLSCQSARKHNVEVPVYEKSVIRQLIQYDWPGNVRELRNFCERMVIYFSGRQVTLNDLPQEFFNAPDNETGNIFHTFLKLALPLHQFEKFIINSALDETNGNQSKAARMLGISRDTLLYRIKKHDIKLKGTI